MLRLVRKEIVLTTEKKTVMCAAITRRTFTRSALALAAATTAASRCAKRLAAEQDLVEMQDLPIRVTDDGYTVVDEAGGRNVHCAIDWKDLATFERKLVKILTG